MKNIMMVRGGCCPLADDDIEVTSISGGLKYEVKTI